ncbi:hypothetical protein AKJ51_00500 [candidate division MSBL1 archaeon SCGC-AAA382A20]|uniref:Uncharacterized protein n=1 Tax=candidate division MSBL1 archaeon SCGC-AAA382A20 TaxID=1698280 RepID=A0A133VMM5_9EURY|nr:hypothetical protein AKJ51_00500 [candidate division MSBL1 archaeon SCGC-AAA382A20]
MNKKKSLFLILLIILPFLAQFLPTIRASSNNEDNLITFHPCEGKYSSYGPYDNAAKIGNIVGGVAGRVKEGNFFFIKLNEPIDHKVWINVEIVNKDRMNRTFSSFIEKISLYRYRSEKIENGSYRVGNNWSEIENKNGLFLTLCSGHLEIEIEPKFLENDKPLALTIESGSFSAREGIEKYPALDHYIEVV